MIPLQINLHFLSSPYLCLWPKVLPRDYKKRYFRSTIKRKHEVLFCIVLTYSYLCKCKSSTIKNIQA